MSGPQFAFVVWLGVILLAQFHRSEDPFWVDLLAALIAFGPLVWILYAGGFFR